jgi:hypothetical protein
MEAEQRVYEGAQSITLQTAYIAKHLLRNLFVKDNFGAND